MAGRRRAGLRRAGPALSVLLAVALAPAAQAAQAPTISAQAQQPPSVQVPRHDAPTLALSLIGASADAVLVNADDEFDGGPAHLYSGPAEATGPGIGDLTVRPALDPDPAYVTYQRLGVVGPTYAWFGTIGRTSTTPDRFILHRTNLLTGADVELEVPLAPVAFTGDSWLAWSGADLVRTTFAGVRTTVLTGATDYLRVVADADGALVTSMSPSAGMQLRRYRLDLITFGPGTGSSTVERVADSLEFIGRTGLSDGSLAWLGRDQYVAHPVSIHLRARAGGVLSTYEETNVYVGDQLELAVGDGRVGYALPDPAGTFLRVVTGGAATATATRVPLPAGGAGIAAVGDRFFTAAGGPTATAGVYAVDGSTPTRLSTVPTPPIGVVALAFSGGRLYTADESSRAAPGMAIWQRDVSGGSRPAEPVAAPVLSAESAYPTRASKLRDISDRSISFSAGRGSLEDPDPAAYRWRLLDRGVVTGTAVQTRPDESDSNGVTNDVHPNTSGPLTLVQGKVYRPDGSLRFTRPGDGSSQTSRDDLYGNRLIYSLADYRANTNTIWVRDLAQPRSSSNPRMLDRAPCRDACPARVSVWGNLVAWAMDEQYINIRNTGTGRMRQIATTAPVQELELGEGVLAWQSPGYPTLLLDLLAKNSKPVAMTGRASTIALDDHWLARRAVDTHRALVYRLPFDHDYHPRLLGAVAATSFTPDGDGRADTWTPAFDTTKPLTGVTLRIAGAESGRTLRTLTGTGPDGSIRDLTWDGRSGAGRALPAGTYRWTLAATAVDGDGALIPAYSGTTLTGTVKLRR